MRRWALEQIADLVGELHARRYRRVKWFELANLTSMTVLLPVGLVFAFRPHHSPLLWWVIGLGAVAVATFTGFGASGLVFARGIGREFGYSTWWCVRRVTLDPAHLIEFLNDEVVARGGTTPPSVAQNLDRELEVEDKIRARARAIQRTGTWFQIGALVLNFVSLVQGLSHYGSSSPQLSTQLPGFTADGKNELDLALGCTSLPTITSSKLTETGDVFTCTTTDGGSVSYSYFATKQDAMTWAREQLTVRHLPVGDVLLGDGWVVVTSDQTVLDQVREIGGEPSTH